MADSLNTLRVMVVATNPLTRLGLGTLLADQQGCVVVGQSFGDERIVADTEVYRPEVVLWALDDDSGTLERLAELRDLGLPVVVLLPRSGDATAVWSAGVRGLLQQDARPDVLASALDSAARGLAVFAPEFAQNLIAHHETPVPLPESLTRREAEVLQFLAEGLPNKTIAQRMNISEHTVKFHVNAILSKMGVQSRTEAVVRATRVGLIAL